MKYLKVTTLLIVFFLIFSKLYAGDPPFLLLMKDQWVNKNMDQMTMDEKIAQLMIVAFYPREGENAKNKMVSLIKKYRPGGILVMHGSPVKTAEYLNELQEVTTIPLLVAIDGEWGLSMRIDSLMPYPYAQALGAIQDSTVIIQMGRDIANMMKRMGIHMNLAPVADINTNPLNPVINFRSFGEDKINVSQKAGKISGGMQEAGVIAVAKHFPGHGDTETDSHKALPRLNHSKDRIDIVESFPFRYMNVNGINAIMTGHLSVPAIDPSGTPSSLSKIIIKEYLRDEIGFQGLVVTDAMNMAGVKTINGSPAVEALKAGNDMLLSVPDISGAIASVREALACNEISLEEIETKCRRVLAIKRWAGLHIYQPVNTDNLTRQLNSPCYEVTNRSLIKASLTVLKRGDLPVKEFNNLKIASVMVGADNKTPFQKMLDRYTNIDHFRINKNSTEPELAILRNILDNYDMIITGIQGINVYPADKYGTTDIQRMAVSDIIRENKTISVFFGNAYALKHFENIHHSAGLILAYRNDLLTQELAAQLIFGAFDAKGRLSVNVDSRFNLNDGIIVSGNKTLAFSIPEEVGINSDVLTRKIDSIAQLGIDSAAYPGCQVLIAKDGNVFFHKCYGFHTYDKKRKVKYDDIYDWASLTKVTGPLPALMKLVDEKKVDLDEPLSNYWPEFAGTDKEKIVIREVLAHQAGLPAWIPFWKMALDNKGKLSRDVFKKQPSKNFTIRVSDHLFMNNDFRKVIYDTIKCSKLLPRKRYVYSGLAFYIFPEIISSLSGQPYEDYLKNNFYFPLGAASVTYNPYKYFPLKKIVPTENDDFFRNERLWGFVHDEGAAMMGGISGNAGLFGNITDLAKIFQMYLQKGYFGGKRFISSETVNEFIRIQYPENNNRRGLGFDKPYMDNHKKKLEDAYPAVDAGKNSFGHTGYAGTFAWADPDNGLLFIFMSNRVHPKRENSGLYDLNIRTAMHQCVYDCLKK